MKKIAIFIRELTRTFMKKVLVSNVLDIFSPSNFDLITSGRSDGGVIPPLSRAAATAAARVVLRRSWSMYNGQCTMDNER